MYKKQTTGQLKILFMVGHFSAELTDLPDRSGELSEIKDLLSDGEELMRKRDLLLSYDRGTVAYDEIKFVEQQVIDRRDRIETILAGIKAEDKQAADDKIKARLPFRAKLDATEQALCDKLFAMISSI